MSDCGLSGITFTQPSLVKPQFAADADIGVVVKRFLRTGVLPEMIDKPNLGDASSLPEDFASLMDRVGAVRQQFERLPAAEREKFNNSCENWLAYLSSSAVEPPAVEPPAVEPPAVEPPVVEPPAVVKGEVRNE